MDQAKHAAGLTANVTAEENGAKSQGGNTTAFREAAVQYPIRTVQLCPCARAMCERQPSLNAPKGLQDKWIYGSRRTSRRAACREIIMNNLVVGAKFFLSLRRGRQS
ncbi:hypothetical protein CBL_06794 [Carabus blaptoides fortunei]